MRRHAYSIKTEEITNKPLAPVIPIRLASGESSKKPEKASKEKAKKELPLFYTEPIFKAKEHDPL